MTPEEKESVINYRLRRGKETLAEIATHVENQLFNTAINRLYYACYYAVIALLHDIKTTTHSGVRQMFGATFVKTGLIPKDLGKFYSDIFDKRQTGDYGDFIDYSEEDLNDLIPSAKYLILKVESLLRL